MLRYLLIFTLIGTFFARANAADFSGNMRFSDADTMDVGAVRVRLFGIDAPETDQKCKRANGKEWSCGKWATRQAKRQFQGKTAICRPVDIDQHGRTVARCYYNGQDIAAAFVRLGMAQAYTRYSLDYVSAEKEASIANIGIWAGTLEDPAAYRAARRQAASKNVNRLPRRIVRSKATSRKAVVSFTCRVRNTITKPR